MYLFSCFGIQILGGNSIMHMEADLISLPRDEEKPPDWKDSYVSICNHLLCAWLLEVLSCLLRVFTFFSPLFLICTVCVVVRRYIISLFFWLGFFAAKSLNYLITLIYFLETSAWSGHKIRVVKVFSVWVW